MPLIPINMILLLIMLLSFGTARAGLPCIHKATDNGFVCVCNATYCDTIEAYSKPSDNKSYILYTTSKAGKVLEAFHGTFDPPGSDDEGCHITINPQNKYQEIYGFGGSFTDAAGENIASLSEGAQHNLMSCYFGKIYGIKYTFARVPIGGSDFSTRAYTLDDVANDLDLEHFELAPEDHKYKIPLIDKAMKMSSERLRLICTAWSAPAWMKTNNDITGFGFLKPEFYPLWAQYHIKFLKAYHSKGIPFWALTCGNEPLNAYIPFIVKFNSMGWHAEDQGKWVVNHLGPLLRDSCFNSCKIIAMDDQRFTLLPWAAKMLSVDNATDFVDGFAYHWYWDNIVPASVLSTFHQKYSHIFLFKTEACEGSKPGEKAVELGSWKRGRNYMLNIIEDLNHDVNAWIDWNLALDLSGGPNWVGNFVDSPIVVNKTRDEFYKQPMFYALAHFSMFMRPHTTRIGFEMKGHPFYKLPCTHLSATVALNQDGTVVVIINNRSSSKKKVILVDRIKGKVKLNLESHSFNTIVY